MYPIETINEERLPFIRLASLEPDDEVKTRSRFERMWDCMPAVSKETERLLAVLFSSAEDFAGIGCDTLRPLWAMEAMERSHNLLKLLLLSQQRTARRPGRHLVTGMKLALAARLADLYREIVNVPERRKVPCSEALRSAVQCLVALFGPAAGNISLRTEIEPITLPAFQRRALVLAATNLVMSSLLQANDECKHRQIVVALRTVGTDRACLAVSDDGIRFHVAAACDERGTAEDMASLLASEVVHQPFGGRGAIAKITFPLQV